MSNMNALLLALLLSASPVTPAATDSVRTDAEIREVAIRHAGAIRNCYETEGLKRNADLRGAIELEITVLATGRVEDARVSRNELTGPGAVEVASCISVAARNWRFARGPYAAETIVLPFTLIPTAPAQAPGSERAQS